MRELNEQIGAKIRAAREERRLTQKELGEFLGYSPMGISYFEQGEREMKVSDLEKLASFFDKPVSHFLSGGVTMFRADANTAGDAAVSASLSAFDKYLIERKKRNNESA